MPAIPIPVLGTLVRELGHRQSGTGTWPVRGKTELSDPGGDFVPTPWDDYVRAT